MKIYWKYSRDIVKLITTKKEKGKFNSWLSDTISLTHTQLTKDCLQ